MDEKPTPTNRDTSTMRDPPPTSSRSAPSWRAGNPFVGALMITGVAVLAIILYGASAGSRWAAPMSMILINVCFAVIGLGGLLWPRHALYSRRGNIACLALSVGVLVYVALSWPIV